MIGKQDVFVTFPWLPGHSHCRHCGTALEQDLRVAIRFFAVFFVPLMPKTILYIYRCRECGAEVCVTSDFGIHLVPRLLLVAVVAAAFAAVLIYSLERLGVPGRAQAYCYGVLAIAAAVATVKVTHSARKACRFTEDTREPGKRSFMSDIENGFWVVVPFFFFLSMVLAHVGLPLVWRGDVPGGLRPVVWRVALLCLILAYYLMKRQTIPLTRTLAYVVVFSAVFTDLLQRLLGLNNFFVALLCFLTTAAVLVSGHYWSLAILRRGGRDLAKLRGLLEGVRSGNATAMAGALEMLGQMLDSPIVAENLDDVVESLQAPPPEQVRSTYGHVPDFCQTLHSLRGYSTDESVLKQRVCLGNRSITIVRDQYVCYREDSLLGSHTRFITLTEIDPEPATRLVWSARWLKASLAPLALLVISTLAMLLAGEVQPISWVVFGSLALFCLGQGIAATGHKRLFYDRYHSQVLFGLYVGRPSRARASAFADGLSAAIRGEPHTPAEPAAEPAQPEPEVKVEAPAPAAEAETPPPLPTDTETPASPNGPGDESEPTPAAPVDEVE